VQTTEATPALVHAGPFGNIAHGTSSLLAHKMGVRLADFVVNECGFAADLGAEKYFDIVMRASGIAPAAAVLVTTAQSLGAQGEGKIEAGFANLDHHIRTLRAYGVPIVVAINRFPSDRPEELEMIATECSLQGLPCALVEAYTRGGKGVVELAHKVVSAIETNPKPEIQPVYSLDDPLETKILKVAIQVYGADGVIYSETARAKLDRCTEWGYGSLPVCIAKTQYSLTDDPKRMGAPKGWTLSINDVLLSAGAGFVVAVSGNMMLMPGLPSHPRAMSIEVDDDGNIFGV
jgi:formate--tetrahydrofolate ligase